MQRRPAEDLTWRGEAPFTSSGIVRGDRRRGASDRSERGARESPSRRGTPTLESGRIGDSITAPCPEGTILAGHIAATKAQFDATTGLIPVQNL